MGPRRRQPRHHRHHEVRRRVARRHHAGRPAQGRRGRQEGRRLRHRRERQGGLRSVRARHRQGGQGERSARRLARVRQRGLLRRGLDGAARGRQSERSRRAHVGVRVSGVFERARVALKQRQPLLERKSSALYPAHRRGRARACCGSSACRRWTALFAHIPARLRATRPLDIRGARRGPLLKHLGEIGARSKPAVGATHRDGAALSFLGAGRHAAPPPVGSRHAAAALRVVHELHAVPAGDLAGHAAGDLRVPDDRQRAVRAGRWPTRRCTTAPRRAAEARAHGAPAHRARARDRGRRDAPALRADHRFATSQATEHGSREDLNTVAFGADGRVSIWRR